MSYQHTCENQNCSKIFNGPKNKKFCSKKCWPSHKEFLRQQMFKDSISTASKGTHGELLVSCFLIRAGFEVFRALSSAASCDLIVLKDYKMYRVEVRSNSSSFTKPKPQMDDEGRYDIFATVVGTDVEFNPPLSGL